MENNLYRGDDEASLKNTISVLTGHLNEQSALANKFSVSWNVKLVPNNGRFNILIEAKNKNKVIAKTITAEEANYFQDDMTTLIKHIAEQMASALMNQAFFDDLEPLLSKAIINLNKLSSK